MSNTGSTIRLNTVLFVMVARCRQYRDTPLCRSHMSCVNSCEMELPVETRSWFSPGSSSSKSSSTCVYAPILYCKPSPSAMPNREEPCARTYAAVSPGLRIFLVMTGMGLFFTAVSHESPMNSPIFSMSPWFSGPSCTSPSTSASSV